jgi:hypothetical protein
MATVSGQPAAKRQKKSEKLGLGEGTTAKAPQKVLSPEQMPAPVVAVPQMPTTAISPSRPIGLGSLADTAMTNRRRARENPLDPKKKKNQLLKRTQGNAQQDIN